MQPHNQFINLRTAALGAVVSLGALVTVSACKSPNLTRRPAQVQNVTHLNAIDSLESFEAMGLVSQGLIRNGRLVKFVIDMRPLSAGGAAKTYFLNANFVEANGHSPDYVRLHYYFSQRVLGYQSGIQAFNDTTYFADTMAERKFVVGSLQTFHLEEQKFLSIHFFPQDLVNEEILAFAAKEVFERIQVDLPRAFVQLGSQQTFATVANKLATLGVKPMLLNEVALGQKMVVMNPGKSIGILRVKPTNVDALSEMDIPIFEDLPLDLSVVAGTITAAPQDIGSHINLKSQERDTPNVVDLDAVAKWSDLDGKAVELNVIDGTTNSEGSYNLKRIGYDNAGVDTGLETVQTHYAEKRRQRTWFNLEAKLDGTSYTNYELMCPTDPRKCLNLISTYGGKAAKLGFLANPKIIGKNGSMNQTFGYRLNPLGFGVPMKIYFKTLALPENQNIRTLVKEIVDSEMGVDPAIPPFPPLEKAEKLRKLQDAFYKAKLPADEMALFKQEIEKLKTNVKTEFSTADKEVILKKVKIRSSSNAEDLPEFDGAGLHNSFTADLGEVADPGEECALVLVPDGPSTKAKMKPDTLECAVLGVFASLWNKRAVEERSHKGINHNSVGMGIAVVPTYNFLKPLGIVETGNGVVITNILSARNLYGYTYTTQDGENLATNPDPETQAEITLANFAVPNEPITFSTLMFATPVKGQPALTHRVLTDAVMKKLVMLTQHIEKQYCRYKPDYNPSCSSVIFDRDKRKSLDMEFKILGPNKDRIMLKQVREFSSGAGSTADH